jgi:Protein of unknown function (DUF2950)
MRSVNRWLEGLIVMACGMGLIMPASSAQQAQERTFASPQQASNALYLAVQNEDQVRLVEILGGKKEIVSTDDQLNDQQERESFVKKYQEMHRLMRRADGAMILYVGAENWPFPMPLVSNKGRWYFDADAGSKEILYRRVGANEITAIETCHALVQGEKTGQDASGFHMPEDQALLEYAHELVSGGTEEHPFGGYYFHKLNEGGAEGVAYVAYPVQYRSSGVMTFVVTNDGKIYEKDLGAKTESAAKELKDWRLDKSWHPAEE